MIPSNINFVGQYFFYIRVEAKGGAVGWSEKLILNVGCGFWIKIIPAGGKFIKKMDLEVGG
jgi:hypothetical protein